MIASSSEENGYIHAVEDLLSPPRGWPASFKSNKVLSGFLNKSIKAKKARLTALPPAEILAEAAAVTISKVDSEMNANRLAEALGWKVETGFAIFELEEVPNVFVAKKASWNVHPRNIWVDLTPRPERHAEVLLVAADQDEAMILAGLMTRPVPPVPAEPVDVGDAAQTGTAAAKEPA